MKSILITGITSELLRPFVEHLVKANDYSIVGTFNDRIPRFRESNIELHKVNMGCESEIDDFISKMDGRKIDYFLQGHGDCVSNRHFEDLNTKEIYNDITINLISGIKILQAILPNMKRCGFGRILLISTASASHGGGITTFTYGMCKSAIEYVVKSLAKEYTQYNILTNAIAPGFFNTRFHSQRAGKTKESIVERAKSVRIGRPGEPSELLSVLKTLLIENTFMSGEIVKIDGADFI